MNDKKVLVVDDEPDLRDLYSQAFRKSGYDVKVAESAEKAMAMFRMERFFVVFLDLNLPGMSGIELCRRLKEESQMIIPYAVTGYASMYELTNCREAGFEDYFTKPVRLNLLEQAADHAFRKLERWTQR